MLAGAVRGGAGVCGNAAQAQHFSAESPPPLPARSVSAAPLRSPSRASAGTMGQCGITSSKTVLVFLNLIFWVSWRAAPAPGGLCAERVDRAGAGASRGLARALRPWLLFGGVFPGPDGGQGCADRRARELGPAGTVPGLRGSPRSEQPAGRSAGSRGRVCRDARPEMGHSPVSRVPQSLSEPSQSQWQSRSRVAATRGRRLSPGPGISA